MQMLERNQHSRFAIWDKAMSSGKVIRMSLDGHQKRALKRGKTAIKRTKSFVEHTPHLQQVLSTVYLIIGANYRNDTIIGSFIWVSNGHCRTGLYSNLLDP